MAKVIDVKNQVRLGITRTFNLTVNGVRFRLFRSSVTVVVIAVAIAFLMNILAEGLVKGSIAHMTGERTKEGRRASRWASRLSVPGTVEEILLEVAGSEEDGPICAEAVRMGGISEDEVASYHAGAQKAEAYLRYFRKLDHVDRRELVWRAVGAETFDRLADREAFEAFRAKLREMKSFRLETSTKDFRSFLDRWPRLKEQTLAIQEKRREAVVKVKEKLAGRTVIEGLAEADGKFGQVVTDAGFAFDKDARAIVATQARQIHDMRALEGTLGKPRVRRLVAAEIDALPAEVNVVTLWDLLRRRRKAAWYLEKLRDIEQIERLDLFCGSIRGFLKELEGVSKAGFESVPESLRARYLKADGTDSSFHDARSVEAVRRLSASARDAWRLVDRFRREPAQAGDEVVTALGSYGSLEALVKEQCEPTKGPPVAPPKDAPDAGARPAPVVVKALVSSTSDAGGGEGAVRVASGSSAEATRRGGVSTPRGVPAYALSVERAHELARLRAGEFALARAERATADVGGGLFGIGERMTWLVIAAMLVSIVGVTNAMLMSVTERFREIATLKCLGALDGTIMLIFVMEAGILGVVGGVIGAVGGIIIGLLRMLAAFGTLVGPAFPVGELALALLLSTVMGVVLAAMASVYPSFRAARLAPMEAMRIQ